MPKQITYLLGAGASANKKTFKVTQPPPSPKEKATLIDEEREVIPPVAGFRSAIERLRDRTLKQGFNFNSFYERNMDQAPLQKLRDRIKVISENQRLLEKFSQRLNEKLLNFSSIDTYARNLFLTQAELLPELKAFINFCFSFWQYESGLDRRYDSLFSLLIEGNRMQPNLPSHIKILTWNYDLQIESCLAQYLNRHRLDQLDEVVRIYPSMAFQKKEFTPTFAVFKLNGSAQTYLNEDGSISKSSFPLEFFEGIEYGSKLSVERNKVVAESFAELVEEYLPLMKDSSKRPFISWSWEGDQMGDQIRNFAAQVCAETEILVVIGYSFPLVNRKIDEKVIRNMRRLERVYIQSPEKTLKDVGQRFRSILRPNENVGMFPAGGNLFDSTIFLRDDIEQFFVPDEAII